MGETADKDLATSMGLGVGVRLRDGPARNHLAWGRTRGLEAYYRLVVTAVYIVHTEVLSVERFRWDTGRLADRTVNHFRHPRPSDTTFML